MSERNKILIADDSPTVVDILTYMLSSQGFEVVVATDGVEAIKMVYQSTPDLILLDVEMPKMNGYQVCRLLKSNAETSSIPIIILTSRDQKIDRFWGLSTGADEYVIKDFESDQLFHTIEEWLAKTGQQPAPNLDGRNITERSVLEQVNHLLDKQLFHSTLVNELGALVVNSLSLEQTVNSVLNLLDNVCDFVIAGIVWQDKNSGPGVFYLPDELDDHLINDMKKRTQQECERHGIKIDTDAIRLTISERQQRIRPVRKEINAHWVHPLTIRDTVIGILILGNHSADAIRPETEETLQIFSKEASIILDNAVLFDRLEVSKRHLENTLHELRETQTQLVHSEKMASLGQLVAGVAHELNNPISFIYGNIDYLEEYTEAMQELIQFYRGLTLDGPQQQKADSLVEDLDIDYILEDIAKVIQSCRNGAERTRQIVLDLRNFSRLDRSDLGQTCVEDSIESTLNLLTNKYKHRIEVHRDYQETPAIECYVGQLNQVFMNLLSNAGDAIADQGNVWIRTRSENEHVIVDIEDDGGGIPPEHLPKIFDPFYTTKPIGKGTGLGLSISYGIVDKHGGTISVESTSGHGTTFTVKLPVRVKSEEGASNE